MNKTHLHIVQERRQEVRAKAAGMGVDEAYISALVDTFYIRVRADRLIGPIFEDTIRDNWDEHLGKMKDFWASVALQAGRYSGEPIPAHKKLAEVQPWHFDVWLELFEETLRDTAPTTDAVAYFMDHAGQIAKGLQIAMFGVSGLGRSGA